jgi:hypothetical protein
MSSLTLSRRALLLAALAPFFTLAVAAAPACAAGAHVPLVSASIPIVGPVLSTLGGAIGSVFSTIGGAVLGAFSWTISLATKFILVTIGALVKMLIPRSWANEGVQIMRWIVAVPDYAGKVTTPGGGHVYGFGGVNALRDEFQWVGIGLLPLTLVYGTSKAMIGERGPVTLPLSRVVILAGALISYPYLWSQAGALVNTITNAILSVPAVTNGLHKLMLYAVDGVALGGWQLIDLGLMAATAIELLALIFLKVAIILLGALLYATGPLLIGLVATDFGSALARAWATAACMLMALGVAWAALFATGAVLINDASTAGPLISGNSSIGSLLGGLLTAIAGLAALYLCYKVAREAGSLLRVQLGGLLALSGRHGGGESGGGGRSQSAVKSLRGFSSRVAAARGAAGGELALAGAGGAMAARAGRGLAYAGRRGVVGTAAGALRHAAGSAAPAAGAFIGRSQAGAVAARMAKAGTASWRTTAPGAAAASAAPRHAQTGGAASRVEKAATGPSAAGTPPPRPAPRSPTTPPPGGASARGNGTPRPSSSSTARGPRAGSSSAPSRGNGQAPALPRAPIRPGRWNRPRGGKR